jgi:ABC-2 type transport system permease protein
MSNPVVNHVAAAPNGTVPGAEGSEALDGATPAAPTRRGVHERLTKLGATHGAPFDPRKTLRLRVEFTRQLKRRRTQLSGLVLLALPIIIALAFKLGGSPSDGNDRAALVGLATVGGANFAMFTEYAAVGFLLVVMVALFCGDTIASEASWASLRYLLAMPVRRSRLLRQKLIVALTFSFGANFILPAWSFLVGGVFFGWAPARSPLGGSFSLGVATERLLIVIAYACISSLVVAGLAFMLSVLTDAPLGAVGGAVMLVVVSNILDSITALDPYRHYLPTHFQYSWLDALGTTIVWDDMIRGMGLSLVYAAVFFGIAWWRFDRKDITS